MPELPRRVARKPNNSFKPTLLRSRPGVVRSRYHAVSSTTQRGLTQVLGCYQSSASFKGERGCSDSCY